MISVISPGRYPPKGRASRPRKPQLFWASSQHRAVRSLCYPSSSSSYSYSHSHSHSHSHSIPRLFSVCSRQPCRALPCLATRIHPESAFSSLCNKTCRAPVAKIVAIEGSGPQSYFLLHHQDQSTLPRGMGKWERGPGNCEPRCSCCCCCCSRRPCLILVVRMRKVRR